MTERPFTRWVTPSGVIIDLIHHTHTSRNRGRKGLRDGGTWDGWALVTRHPASGVVISTTYLGATVPEAELAEALAAVDAVPTLPRVPRTPQRPVSP